MKEEGELKELIDFERVPRHVAMIMDGNGRWAKKHGKHRLFGHTHGVESVRETLVGASEIGVEYLTLYAFSTENWSRPSSEVDALMDLLVKTILNEVEELNKNEVRLLSIGDTERLPEGCKEALNEAIRQTSENKRVNLVLALSYSSRWEITEMARKIAREAKERKIDPENIDEGTVEDHLTTKGIPDPELLIRTSGEQRISNYLLWQLAYTELYFSNVLWPEFKKDDFFRAIIDFQNRERRFGKISEQVEL